MKPIGLIIVAICILTLWGCDEDDSGGHEGMIYGKVTDLMGRAVQGVVIYPVFVLQTSQPGADDNPFSDTLRCSFTLANAGQVLLTAQHTFDSRIDTIVNEWLPAGFSEVAFATTWPNGKVDFTLNGSGALTTTTLLNCDMATRLDDCEGWSTTNERGEYEFSKAMLPIDSVFTYHGYPTGDISYTVTDNLRLVIIHPNFAVVDTTIQLEDPSVGQMVNISLFY